MVFRKQILRHFLEEITCPYGQRFSEFGNVFQRDIAFTSFDATDVISMKASTLCQLLLGVPALFAQCADGSPKECFDGWRRHTIYALLVTTMGLHTMRVILSRLVEVA